MEVKNYMKMTIAGYSRNEALARMCVSAFAAQLDPTIEELSDIKAAVSEAVTNCIVHAYRDTIGEITLLLRIVGDNGLYIRIKDNGCGIEDVKKAREPLFTTSPDSERAGLGFAVMESFTDQLSVRSTVGRGTTVTMIKRLNGRNEQTERSIH
ncbi:MAG: anti-sigma F factor [Bacteroides sp.]|nr:anti-sigma F factor [Eubacterium sp.]MCM1418420.1 anti-sigma F factor [Roseburia sp.]MCM1461558.1 anti-sigma F factor [Bacteroides sp.]